MRFFYIVYVEIETKNVDVECARSELSRRVLHLLPQPTTMMMMMMTASPLNNFWGPASVRYLGR